VSEVFEFGFHVGLEWRGLNDDGKGHMTAACEGMSRRIESREIEGL